MIHSVIIDYNNMKNNIIIYDTDCGFCDWTRDIIEKYDRDNIFSFISITSDQARDLAQHHNQIIDQQDPESFILCDIENGSWYTKSDAGYHISHKCYGPLYVFSLIITITPRFVADFVYTLIARNRAKLGPLVGRKTCKIR